MDKELELARISSAFGCAEEALEEAIKYLKRAAYAAGKLHNDDEEILNEFDELITSIRYEKSGLLQWQERLKDTDPESKPEIGTYTIRQTTDYKIYAKSEEEARQIFEDDGPETSLQYDIVEETIR